MCGDYNINLLLINENINCSRFFECILGSGYLPSITLPTRLSDNSTLIDNIIYNKQRNCIFAGILENQISDHQAILINTVHRPPPSKSRYVTIYNNSDASKDNFRMHIHSLNHYATLDNNLYSDPNRNYEIIVNAITNSMNIYLTIKVVKFNKKKHKKEPWITYGILNSVNHKNKLYKRLKKTKSHSPEYDLKKSTFNNYRNLLRRTIWLAKKNYFCKTFTESKNNMKKTWITLIKC